MYPLCGIFILNLNKNTPPTYKKIKKENGLEEDTQKENMDENDDNMDENVDNTPLDLRDKPSEVKSNFIYSLVAEVLKDLLPMFKECNIDYNMLHDFPLEGGRKQYQDMTQTSTSAMKDPHKIDEHLAQFAASQVTDTVDLNQYVHSYMEVCSSSI